MANHSLSFELICCSSSPEESGQGEHVSEAEEGLPFREEQSEEHESVLEE